MSLLGLLLGSIIQRNLADADKLKRFAGINGAVEVHAGQMVVTLHFEGGKLTISRGAADSPRATVRGSLQTLMGLSLGSGMVGPWLSGRLKAQGSLLMLLKLKPLLAVS